MRMIHRHTETVEQADRRLRAFFRHASVAEKDALIEWWKKHGMTRSEVLALRKMYIARALEPFWENRENN